MLVACCWDCVSGLDIPLPQPADRLAFQSSLPQPQADEPGLQQVEQALLETAKQNPNDFAAQQRLGEFYLQQNRLPEGILYLEKAQQLNPQDYNTGYDLSLAYLNSGDTAKASAQLHKMITQHETAELDDLLAEVNEKSGDYKDGRDRVLSRRRTGSE